MRPTISAMSVLSSILLKDILVHALKGEALLQNFVCVCVLPAGIRGWGESHLHHPVHPLPSTLHFHQGQVGPYTQTEHFPSHD